MATDIQVLLVDDNPTILEMLRQALSPLAHISTAKDGADALIHALESPPDLLITDYQMPSMNGHQLVEKLHSRVVTARLPVIVMASKSDLNEKLGTLRDSVDDFIEKPFFLREATARAKRIIDKVALEKMARHAAGESRVRGSLAQMNVIDLLQSLELGRKTCRLIVSRKNESCEMFFTEGQLVHAVFGTMNGDDAVYHVLAWQDGTWEIDFTGSANVQTVTRSTQGLLMEGLRLLDEANRDAGDGDLNDA